MNSLRLLPLVLLLASFCPASPILDQSYQETETIFGGWSRNNNTFGRTQTFTVGLDGILARVDVMTSAMPDRVRILQTSGGTPVGGALGLGVLAESTAGVVNGDWYSFDFTAENFVLTAGEVYGIEPMGETGPGWSGELTGTYTGGQSYFFNTSSSILNWTLYSGDFFFQTFVVPEPGAAMLFAAGALLTALLRRRLLRN
jgi:hypothetical protein